eukprot:2520979-Rhodomonas_salina.1
MSLSLSLSVCMWVCVPVEAGGRRRGERRRGERAERRGRGEGRVMAVSYTHLRAHETEADL